MKDTLIKVLKYPAILTGVIILTSLVFVFTQYLKDTFFLGPEPDLNGKSILFEANGAGVQLFWRHYQENNEYTDEYLFDKPILGDLSDVLLQDDGLWFIVSEDIRTTSDIYIYKVFENKVREMAFFNRERGSNLARISSATEIELVKKPEDLHRYGFYYSGATIFESNYMNVDNRQVTTFRGNPSCTQGFGGFRLPCFFGYLKTDELIRVDEPTKEYLRKNILKEYNEFDYTVLYKTMELALPFETVVLGKRFTNINNQFILSNDKNYVLLPTEKLNENNNTHNYVVHVDSGKIMKISEGDVPVLML